MSTWLSWTGADTFMPHGHCYQWTPELLALMVGSDALIALAYFAIPALMLYLTRAKATLPFRGIFVLFSAFIVLCGITHAVDAITTWFPAYWLEGVLKLLTGLVSAATAISVIPVLPRAMAYRSPAELQAANDALRESNARLQSANAELEQLYVELRESQRIAVQAKALQRSNEELEAFSAAVSHDLRAPLRGIRRAAEWLAEDEPERLSEDQRELVELIGSRTRRLDGMVTGLLQHFKLGRGQEPLERLHLPSTVDEAIALADVPSDFTVVQDVTDQTVVIAPAILNLVLGNLILNAVKHHDRQEGSIGVSASVHASTLQLVVEDDGPGIPDEDKDRVFGLFTTLQAKDEVESTGMGLSFVHRAVTGQGGTIHIEDARGRGARFVISWPLPPEAGTS